MISFCLLYFYNEMDDPGFLPEIIPHLPLMSNFFKSSCAYFACCALFAVPQLAAPRSSPLRCAWIIRTTEFCALARAPSSTLPVQLRYFVQVAMLKPFAISSFVSLVHLNRLVYRLDRSNGQSFSHSPSAEFCLTPFPSGALTQCL